MRLNLLRAFFSYKGVFYNLHKKSTWLFLLLFSTFSFGQYSDDGDLKDAVNAATEGGTFVVSNGTYNDFSATFENKATEENPIIIKAETIGGVTLTGDSGFVLKKSAYITIEGFIFDCYDAGTLIKLEGCNNIRITRNVFEQEQVSSAKWVYIGGVWDDKTYPFINPSHTNRIDHNIFQNKNLPGHYITIDGSTDDATDTGYQSQYDRIDHNHFINNGPRAVNEQESIRIGWSEMSMSSGYTTVEFNLFEDCDGDPEIVSVKSCDNIVRHNTFKNSYGTLSLRHGNRNRVEGNYFFGNGKAQGTSEAGSNLYTGGVRIYGTDHVIINNYFEGLNGTKWDAPITLTLGDKIDGSSTNWSSHFRAEDILIAYNTLVNNDHGIEIGYSNNGKYDKDLENITIANNLITGSKNALVEIIDGNDQGSTITWINNLMYPTEAAVTIEGNTTTIFNGTTDAISEDPNLVLNTNITYDNTSGVWKTSATTPLYEDGVTSETVNLDIDGQDRSETSNPGADHFSSESVRYNPLTTADVGPYANDDGTIIDNLSVTTIGEFSVEGGTKTSTIVSNISWTVTDNSDWITVTPTEGTGNGSISITATANSSPAKRTGTVTVSGGSLSRNISVSQEAADPTSGLELINDNSVNDNVSVTASTEQSGNEAINTLDKDLDTRWSGEGIGAEIIYDLGSVYDLSLVSIATLSGKTYLYEIWVSEDGETYNFVSNIESNTTGTYEHYSVASSAQFVKIVGKGQSGGSLWNSITEIQFWSGSTNVSTDDDNDGVLNENDLCPNTPTDEDVDANGCSDSQNNGLIPADLMENCKQWKITYPTGVEDKTLCDEPNNEFFYVNNTDDAIVFRTPIRKDNGTTPNSSYIRSELRERVADGSKDIYWTTEGSHMVYVKQAITHLPMNKSHLVATQIHGNKEDGIDDSMVMRLEDSHLFLSFNGGKLRDHVTIKTDYQLGDIHEVIFLIFNGKHYCYYSEDGNLLTAYNNGTADSYLIKADGNDYVMDLNYDETYFKIGNYTQSNPEEEGDDTDDPNNYGEVLVYDFTVAHDEASVSSVTLTPETMDVLIGNSFQLDSEVIPTNATNTNVTYSSSDNSIVQVDVNGTIEGLKEGSATITVTTEDGGFTDTSEIHVYQTSTKENIALNKTIQGTGTHHEDNVVSNLIDGDVDTRWSVEGFPQSATIDLGEKYKFERTELITYSNRAYQYSIEVAENESGPYTQIVDRTSNTSPTTENHPNVSIFSEVEAQFIKITVVDADVYDGDWISLAEFRVFGTSMDTDPNDLDGDGVINELDDCPNTTKGVNVNQFGCEILASDNFTIEIQGETCLGNNDGSVFISAKDHRNYTITLNGENHIFTDEISIDGLEPITYELCIEEQDVTATYCYSFNISGGIQLLGKSTLTKDLFQFKIIEGTKPFQVFLNDEFQFETIENEVSIKVKPGDSFELKTAVLCEGVYAEKIQLENLLTAFPNPTTDWISFSAPFEKDEVPVEIYDSNAKLLYSGAIKSQNSLIQIDLSDYNSGMYFVKLYDDVVYTYKIIKE